MRAPTRTIFLDALKIAIFITVFSLVQSEIIEIRQDLHGNANGIAEAQSRTNRELNETRQVLRNAVESTNVQFSQARKVFEESTEMLQGERRELTRLIDDRTGAIESTLRDRMVREREQEAARIASEGKNGKAGKLEARSEQDLASMKRQMVYPTVQLRGDGTVGSGVLIYSQPQGDESSSSATFVLTAHHVVLEVMGGKASRKLVEEIRVLDGSDAFDPEVLSGEVVLTDRDHDLALLRLRTGRRFPYVIEFAPREEARKIDVFTPAYAVGCPLGNRPLPTAGEISSKSKVVGDQVFWMLNAPTFFGNSGGGIYLGSTCQLIGISSMIYTYGKTAPTVVPHMGLFVPLDALYDWLDAEGHSFLYRKEPVPSNLLARYGIGKATPSRN
jgi:S1-C subfamily serine protease